MSAIALAKPVSTLAAQSSAVVAWLSSLHPSHSVTLPFMLRGLAETGYVEGRNLTIKDASAEGHPERFPERAAEVVNERISLIAAVSGLPSVEAARAHTSTIPIVFIVLGDPVELDLVASINHPGGNLTGIGGGGTLMLAKQMEVLSEVVHSEGAQYGGGGAPQGRSRHGVDTWLRIIVATGELGEPPIEARDIE